MALAAGEVSEVPGGLEIEFQDFKDAAEKVASSLPWMLPATLDHPESTFVAIAEQDPNLALVGLRIEIEQRLRVLADHSGMSSKRSLSQLTTDLQLNGVIEPEAASGLRDLNSLGN